MVIWEKEGDLSAAFVGLQLSALAFSTELKWATILSKQHRMGKEGVITGNITCTQKCEADFIVQAPSEAELYFSTTSTWNSGHHTP